jgi:uncharacterized protein YfdQ (DUF2303 family)
MELEKLECENIAQTLVRELPRPIVIHETFVQRGDVTGVFHVAVPQGFELKTIDDERLLEHPRRTAGRATLTTATSFIEYVKRHAKPATVVWCAFDPQRFALAFCAVFDEHGPEAAGWRSHRAAYTPELSAEWKTWVTMNKQAKPQLEFAEFLERNQLDIASVEGYPSSLDMLRLATEFEASSEKRIRSIGRLQGGGVRLEYVDDDDAQTLTAMQLYEKFAIGIPVFWAGAGYRIDARLKYRQASAKVSFWYDLIRPDRVHEAAASELIAAVRESIGTVPLLMGACE